MGRLTEVERFLSKIRYSDEGCFIWVGSFSGSGQCEFSVGGRKGTMVDAKRYAWKLFTGKSVPSGMVLYSRCHNPLCVSSTHHVPVSRKESCRLHPRTHCPYGHEYTPENTYRSGKYKHCKTCAAKRRGLIESLKYGKSA